MDFQANIKSLQALGLNQLSVISGEWGMGNGKQQITNNQ
jgi:hypothetical protein